MGLESTEALLSDYDEHAGDQISSCERTLGPKDVLLPRWKAWTLMGTLAISICLNISLLVGVVYIRDRVSSEPTSRYVNLKYSQEIPLPSDTQYCTTPNETHMDFLWETLEGLPGPVALDANFVKEKQLPATLEFPWDSSKGVYIVSSFHSLHCLRMLYISITEAHRGHNQSLRYFHLVHCLDRFRQEIKCHADDTLLGIHRNNKDSDGNELAVRTHQCRDWSALKTWAQEHSACFTDHFFKHPQKWDNFKNCPADSPYLPKVREHFNLSDDWLPDFDKIGY